MSDLLKKALNKGKPPKMEEEMNEEDEDEYDEEEECMNENQQSKGDFQSKFPQTKGPIKPTQHFSAMPPKPSDNFPKYNKKVCDYSPLSWKDYFDEQEFLENKIPIYEAGKSGPLFFCLHGAGDSAQSFACLAKEVKQFASLVTFDFRGHGDSKIEDNKDDLSVDTLIADAQKVLEYIAQKYEEPTFIIVGHSMGGSIASKYTQYALTTALAPRIQGLIVIDVVEGTAMDALPFMGQIVSSRPQKFSSYEELIQWSIKSSTLRNVTSARVSMPPKVRAVEEGDKKHYEWKVNLMKSEKHWVSWFKGLTASFLDVRIPKLLMTAEKERMDKDLTIAQMQGRFKLSVIYNTGHYMQEDDYVQTAIQFHQFLSSFRVPQTTKEQEKQKQIGVGKFVPEIIPYNPQIHKGLHQ